MLRPSRNRAGTFVADFLHDSLISATCMDIGGFGWQSNNPSSVVGRYQLALSSIPFGKNFMRRGAAQDTGMDQSRETNPGNVSG
jgi:hypothetical protein